MMCHTYTCHSKNKITHGTLFYKYSNYIQAVLIKMKLTKLKEIHVSNFCTTLNLNIATGAMR